MRVLPMVVLRLTLLAGFILFGPLCATAHAQMGWTRIIGGGGGGNFEDKCPEGALLIGAGFSGYKDVNTITAYCQRFENGRWAGERTELTTHGVGAVVSIQIDSDIICPQDMAVYSIRVGVSHVGLVHEFSFRCRNPGAHDTADSPTPRLRAGETAFADTVECSGEAMASGLVGKYGTLIDALGLYCKAFPVKAIKAARGVPATPAAPVKAIKNSRGTPAPLPTPQATATEDVDMYIGPSGDTPVLGVWRKGSRATPLQSQDGWCKLQGINNGQDAWVWGEFVSGCV